ncbi:Threonine aldolase, partial [Cladochytrium tenue]
EDPTVQKLHQVACELTGHDAALFCASGTMSNQLGIRCNLGAPPHSVVCDHRAHVHNYESSAIAFFNGATTFPILPLEDIKKISEFARDNDIKMHLDGARLWNASIATGISLKEYSQQFDSVSLCLSKGLGAPVGSILVGSHGLIAKAKHFRKMLGGGWRQAGILAAAGLYAIEHHWANLQRDHEHAKLLADGLERLGFKLTARCDTNMVWVDTAPLRVRVDNLRDELERNDIRIFGDGGVGEIRFVTHHQVSRDDVGRVLSVIEAFVAKAPKTTD